MPGTGLGPCGKPAQSPVPVLGGRSLFKFTQPVSIRPRLGGPKPHLSASRSYDLICNRSVPDMLTTLSKTLHSLGLSFPMCKLLEQDLLRSLSTLTIRGLDLGDTRWRVVCGCSPGPRKHQRRGHGARLGQASAEWKGKPRNGGQSGQTASPWTPNFSMTPKLKGLCDIRVASCLL